MVRHYQRVRHISTGHGWWVPVVVGNQTQLKLWNCSSKWSCVCWEIHVTSHLQVRYMSPRSYKHVRICWNIQALVFILRFIQWYLIQSWKVAASHCLGNWELLTYPFLLLHWTVNNSWSWRLVVSETHQGVIQKSWYRLSTDASIFTWLYCMSCRNMTDVPKSFAEPFSTT